MDELIPPVLQVIFVAIQGLVLGSFVTAMIWRIPRGISIYRTSENGKSNYARSCCSECRTVLGIIDLIPLFSWLLQNGRCRYCKTAISWRYPAVELLTSMACLGIYFAFGFAGQSLIFYLLVPVLMALIFIDIDHLILPDGLVLAAGLLGAIALIWNGVNVNFSQEFWQETLSNILGAVIYAGLLYALGHLIGVILKKEALGFGDVKFLAVAGLWLGLEFLPFYMMCAGALGVLFGVVYQCVYKSKIFPFGPALIISLYICLILNQLDITPFINGQILIY